VDNRTDIQVGANKGQELNVSIEQLDSKALGLDKVSVASIDHAGKSITLIDRALGRLNSARGTIGAQINRLEYAIKGLGIAHQNLTASESRIRDLDIAEETGLFVKNQLLVQSCVSMLAQANQLPYVVLQLIQG
jgi:flagellin